MGELERFHIFCFQLSRIESSAEASMRCGDYLGALWKYSCAVLVCVQGNQLNLLPAVRAKCVQVALLVRGADELEGLLYAYKQAYCNVKAKPDSDEVCEEVQPCCHTHTHTHTCTHMHIIHIHTYNTHT